MSQLPIPLSISLYVNTRMKATGLKLTEAEKWMFWTGTTTDQLEGRKAVRCDKVRLNIVPDTSRCHGSSFGKKECGENTNHFHVQIGA